MSIGNGSEEVRNEYLKIAGNYSIPIFWVDSKNVPSNGTAFVNALMEVFI